MSDFLANMARSSVERAASVDPDIGDGPFGRPLAPLDFEGFDLIAEIKERSPAEGELATTGEDRVERARQYVAGGAAAISVLTEPSRFAGSLEHLEAVLFNCVRRGPPVPHQHGMQWLRDHLTGRVAWARHVNPRRARRVVELLEKIDWST